MNREQYLFHLRLAIMYRNRSQKPRSKNLPQRLHKTNAERKVIALRHCKWHFKKAKGIRNAE